MRYFKNFSLNFLIASLFACLFAGCGTTEDYVLMNDMNTDNRYKMMPMHELRIKRGDELQIVVTHKMPELIAMFNRKINALEEGERMTRYTVNEDGYINFPYFDTVKVLGLTCTELERKISGMIEEAGLANGSTVTVKITNFKVTVIGETGTGIYRFDDGHVTILDLVAKANMLTPTANINGGQGVRRDKILVMREINGVMNAEYVSLLSKDILYSPYFYLQQNDVVYVWPTKSTIRSSNKVFDFWWQRFSVITSLISLAALVISISSMNN